MLAAATGGYTRLSYSDEACMTATTLSSTIWLPQLVAPVEVCWSSQTTTWMGCPWIPSRWPLMYEAAACAAGAVEERSADAVFPSVTKPTLIGVPVATFAGPSGPDAAELWVPPVGVDPDPVDAGLELQLATTSAMPADATSTSPDRRWRGRAARPGNRYI